MKKNILRMIFSCCVCLFLLFAITFSGFSQTNIDFTKQNFPLQKKELRKAIRLINKGDKCLSYQLKGKYAEALDYFLEANNFNPNNAFLNYKIGVCYTGSYYKNNSLYYLETAKKIDPAITNDIDYYLGMAYQYNLQFNNAIESYKKYLTIVPEKDLVFVAANIEKKIKECEFGLEFLSKQNKLIVKNLGSDINSMWDDYSPVVSSNDSVMAFTTRRKSTTGQKINKYDYLFYEDVFFSYKDDNNIWSPPINPGKPINNSRNDGSVDISKNGKILTLYKNKNGTENLYETTFKNNKWTVPVKLSRKINKSNAYETSATYTNDRKTIYFTSEDKKSIGGLDIYTSTVNEQGIWSEAINLGKVINTTYDEDAVYLVNDSLLYFSSQGHNSMGDFDIFFSKKIKNEWSEPVNMGYPMNSPSMDMFLFFNGVGNAYFSSDRQGGSGGMDLYFVKYTMTTDELIANLNPITIKSLFIDDITQEIVYASSSVKDISNNKVVFDGVTDSTGIYDMLLSSTKEYQMSVLLKDYDETKAKKIKTGIGTKYTDTYLPENRKKDTIPPTTIKGIITDNIKNIPVQALIDVVDIQNNTTVATITPDTLGNFSIILPSQMDYKFIFRTTACGHKKVIAQVKEVNYTTSIVDGSIIQLENIYFDFDRNDVRSDAIEILNRHASLFNQHKDWKISIDGHTDNMGSLTYNYFLSKNRSLSVVDYLIKKGVKKSRMKVNAFGYDKPAISNQTKKARQLNRRVEFKVYK